MKKWRLAPVPFALALAVASVLAGCCQSSEWIVERPLPDDPAEPCLQTCGPIILDENQECIGCAQGLGADGQPAVLCVIQSTTCTTELH